MKKLPDEQTLLELINLAKDAENSARQDCEIITQIAYEWEKRLEKKQSAKQAEKLL
jgi:hypothetical protein